MPDRPADPFHVERPKKMADGKTYCSCGAPWPCWRIQANSHQEDKSTVDVIVPDVAIVAVLAEHLWLGPGAAQPAEARYCRTCTRVEADLGRLVAVAWPCPTYAALASVRAVAPIAASVERNHPDGVGRTVHP